MVSVCLKDEISLLRGVADGDPHAFKRIYDHYHEMVYTFALWYLKSETDAEEVVQETFLKLWVKGPSILEIKDLKKYLRTLAVNRALDMLRYKARRPNIPSFNDLDGVKEPFHNETEESIILKEAQHILQAGIDQLPEKQKNVYLLCREKGMKNDEVAKQLNVSPHTVRTHMKLALRFLREHMQKHTDKMVSLPIIVLFKIF